MEGGKRKKEIQKLSEAGVPEYGDWTNRIFKFHRANFLAVDRTT